MKTKLQVMLLHRILVWFVWKILKFAPVSFTRGIVSGDWSFFEAKKFRLNKR